MLLTNSDTLVLLDPNNNFVQGSLPHLRAPLHNRFYPESVQRNHPLVLKGTKTKIVVYEKSSFQLPVRLLEGLIVFTVLTHYFVGMFWSIVAKLISQRRNISVKFKIVPC